MTTEEKQWNQQVNLNALRTYPPKPNTMPSQDDELWKWATDACIYCHAWFQFPLMGTENGDWITTIYQCSTCGGVWTCGQTVGFAKGYRDHFAKKSKRNEWVKLQKGEYVL